MRKRQKDRMRMEERLGSIVICAGCMKACDTKVVDFGIGPYDAGGATGIDEQLELVSECCEEELVSFSDWEEAYDWIEEKYSDVDMKLYKVTKKIREMQYELERERKSRERALESNQEDQR